MDGVSLELRAVRSRRQSQRRRAEQRSRLKTRRVLRRALISIVSVAAVGLAMAAGPGATTSIARSFDPVSPATRCPMPDALRPAFADAAKATGVGLGLLTAVAQVESRFDANAVSPAGAVGILQLMPTTAAALHYDPQETTANVMAGALYLRELLDRYRSTPLALAAYNAGPTAVDRHGPRPTAETAAYVDRVQALAGAYGNCR